MREKKKENILSLLYFCPIPIFVFYNYIWKDLHYLLHLYICVSHDAPTKMKLFWIFLSSIIK